MRKSKLVDVESLDRALSKFKKEAYRQGYLDGKASKEELTEVSCDGCLSKKLGLCTVCVRNPCIRDYYRLNDN